MKLSETLVQYLVIRNNGSLGGSRGNCPLFKIGTRSYIRRLGGCPRVGCANKIFVGLGDVRD